MSRLRIRAQDVFDGVAWVGPASIVVDGDRIVTVDDDAAGADLEMAAVIPGLVDFGVTAIGYVDTPAPEHPFVPESAFAALCLRHGVLTIVDVNNAPGAVAHLEGAAQEGEGPRLVHSGARLASLPTSRQDVTVDATTAERRVSAQAAAGAAFISIGVVDDDVLAAISRAAEARGLPVVIGDRDARQEPGLTFVWPAEGRSLVAPQLEATVRWSVEGLLAATEAAQAAPVLPFARHFARMDGGVGRRIGRSVLRRLYPHRLERLEPPPCDAIREALADGRCLAASGAAAGGLVPGLSLWHELARFEELDVPQAEVLHAATGIAERVLPAAAVGRVRPGAAADLLLLAEDARDRPIAELHQTVTHLVVRGEVRPVDPLVQHVDVLVAGSLKEAR